MAVQVISGRRHGKAALGRCLMGMLVLNLLSVTPCHCKSATFQRLPYMDDYIIYTPPDNLDTLVARRTNFTSASQCAASCLTEDECSSFFYDAADGLCLMHSVVFLAADEAAAKLGTTYWQLSQGERVMIMVCIFVLPAGEAMTSLGTAYGQLNQGERVMITVCILVLPAGEAMTSLGTAYGQPSQGERLVILIFFPFSSASRRGCDQSGNCLPAAELR